LFVKQLKAGEPLTITDPNMTRFMMSIDDAVDLVLYAYRHSRPGDIFVQKSPAATIGTLAQAILKVFRAQNDIRVIGTRHGEKLYETLLTREERVRAEDMGGYFRVLPTRGTSTTVPTSRKENRGSRRSRTTTRTTRIGLTWKAWPPCF